jgi:protein gp37
MIFVNSMSDLFHPAVPTEYIIKVGEVMSKARWHTFQVLTKRADRMRELLNGPLSFVANEPHVWWGVSVENRKHGVPRIDELQKSKVHTRFLSIEPLLEDVGILDLREIHWVIVGGESGRGARPIHEDWVLRIKDQCHDSRVPFFFKQWGGVRKGKTGRQLNGRTYDEMPVASELVRISAAG